MKYYYIVSIITLLCYQSMNCQSVETDSLAKAEISKLAFMVGNWSGSGWMIGQDRSKSDFDQTEHIEFKLDNTTILIEGKGVSNGKVIHNALAIISYNKSADNYSFQSFMQNGRKGEFQGELIEDRFYWYPNKNTRYVILLNEKGQWYETGEFNRDDQWFQFFEMKLDKKK